MSSRKSRSGFRRNGFGLDASAETGLYVGSDLNRIAQDLFEFNVKAREIQEAATFLYPRAHVGGPAALRHFHTLE